MKIIESAKSCMFGFAAEVPDRRASDPNHGEDSPRALVHSPSPRRTSRFARLVAALACLVVALVCDRGRAEEAVLPIALQVELLVKVASYDRNFQQRAGDRAHIIIFTKPGNGDSARVAAQVEAGLSRAPQIGGLPHDEVVTPYQGAAEVANLCRDRHAAIIFFGPGFRDDVAAIREALDGVDVLSAAAIPEYVPAGIVLGFDVASGRPELLVNLTQAKRQKVALRADVLKLMKVFQ
jgi:hypothetical protein